MWNIYIYMYILQLRSEIKLSRMIFVKNHNCFVFKNHIIFPSKRLASSRRHSMDLSGGYNHLRVFPANRGDKNIDRSLSATVYLSQWPVASG